jgi:hypothetical protein
VTWPDAASTRMTCAPDVASGGASSSHVPTQTAPLPTAWGQEESTAWVSGRVLELRVPRLPVPWYDNRRHAERE